MLNFFLGLISVLGFYPLFYKLNKPAARWRSIALLAAVILGYPLSLLWQSMFYRGVESPSLFDATVIHVAIFLLVWVFLGINRLKGLIAASFTFSIIHLTQIPVGYIMLYIFSPLTGRLGLRETILQYPLFYYSVLFVNNSVIAVICFFAARWLRAGSKAPPVRLYVSFNLLFVIFPLAVFLLWEDIVEIISVAFIAYVIVGSLFLGMLVFLFYLYTRLTADNPTGGAKEKTGEYARLVQRLSRREQEVVEAIAAGGIRYKDIAGKLNISVNTVKYHLKNIYQTAGIYTLKELSALLRGFAAGDK